MYDIFTVINGVREASAYECDYDKDEAKQRVEFLNRYAAPGVRFVAINADLYR